MKMKNANMQIIAATVLVLVIFMYLKKPQNKSEYCGCGMK